MLAAPLALVVLSSALAYGDPRFRVAFDVALAVLCGVGADALLRRRDAMSSAARARPSP